MRPPHLLLLCAILLSGWLPAARAAEPFFKKGDVIAIVGGEDMVALSEYGYLELLLTRALPDFHLRFRNLAWEGDTVFEQRRDLGFPPWEEQLEKIGATVVLCQFGQMESLAGKEKLPEFIAAYEKLLARFSGGGKRRVAVIAWTVEPGSFTKAIDEMAKRNRTHLVDVNAWLVTAPIEVPITRDGIHLNNEGHVILTNVLVESLIGREASIGHPKLWLNSPPKQQLHTAIIAKNRLWFDYWRVQNWAFLAGDRTNQPSSRDHLDPQKRWFPEERERFLPLIEAKEKEIDALAAQLAAPAPSTRP